MSRRNWLLAAGLIVALAVPGLAAAKIVSAGGPPRGFDKPVQRNVIAVRHGHRIMWLSRSHGLAARNLSTIKLSPDVRFGRSAHAAIIIFTPITVSGDGFQCNANGNLTSDSISYYESYRAPEGGPPLYADTIDCSGNNGGTAESSTVYPYPSCYNPYAKSVQHSGLLFATFTDGEYTSICNVPDDDDTDGNGSGVTNANTVPYTVYQQGFSCQATVGIGSDDNTADNIKNRDSIEFYENYVDRSGNPTSSITTNCVGRLPSDVTISSTPVYHLVGCSEYNPNGGIVQGYGESITYPDHQYSETCNVPDVQPPVVVPAS